MGRASRIGGEGRAVAAVAADGGEEIFLFIFCNNIANSSFGDMGKRMKVNECLGLGILKTESEMKERDRQILKKSKVKWEEGTVECAWEREREDVYRSEEH